jgi:hypothetical protein
MSGGNVGTCMFVNGSGLSVKLNDRDRLLHLSARLLDECIVDPNSVDAQLAADPSAWRSD